MRRGEYSAAIPESVCVFHIALREIMRAKDVGKLALKIFEHIDKLIRTIHNSLPDKHYLYYALTMDLWRHRLHLI